MARLRGALIGTGFSGKFHAESLRRVYGLDVELAGVTSHSGSASDVYGIWRFQGGGSLMGKGCHPLTALLYLKRVEGFARAGGPIRPAAVSCRCERLTRMESYDDTGFIRMKYHDTEDYVWAHVRFADGMMGDIVSSEVILGGTYNHVEVFANNHRTRAHLGPVTMVDTFNPAGRQYADLYTVEKTSTKEGRTALAPEENYTLGYLAEVQDFLTCAATGARPRSDLDLAVDTTTTIYAAYLSDERGGAETTVPLL